MKLIMILQLVIAVGLINVWLLDLIKLLNIEEEMQNMEGVYSIWPVWLMYLVGTMKIAIAIMLIIIFGWRNF